MTTSTDHSMFSFSRGRMIAPCAALVLSTFALTASAASNVTVTNQALVPKPVEHVLGVLATSDICDSGCRYYSPDTVKEIRISHKATATSFYKWSYVDNTKDTKFFTHYEIKKTDTGAHVHLRTLQKGKDDALIAELEAKTKFEHDPIFDSAVTDYYLTREGDKTRVKVRATTRVSGFVEMFKGKVKKGMVETIAALLKNFKR